MTLPSLRVEIGDLRLDPTGSRIASLPAAFTYIVPTCASWSTTVPFLTNRPASWSSQPRSPSGLDLPEVIERCRSELSLNATPLTVVED